MKSILFRGLHRCPICPRIVVAHALLLTVLNGSLALGCLGQVSKGQLLLDALNSSLPRE